MVLTIIDRDLSSVRTGIPLDRPSTNSCVESKPTESMPSTSGRAKSMPFYMLQSSPKSSFIDIDLLRLQTVYNIPNDLDNRLPAIAEHPDWTARDYVCFYEIAF